MRLIENCEMVFVDKRLQPIYTVVLDCPGKDSIRQWPMPVVDPWDERRKIALDLQVGETKAALGEHRDWKPAAG